MKKIIVIGTLPSSLINFRGELLKALVVKKHYLIAMASGATPKEVSEVEKIAKLYVDYPVQRSGLNPFVDFETFLTLKKIIKSTTPDIVLAYTIKPIIWGGLASKFMPKVKFYALVTGLGFAFQKGGFAKNVLIKIVGFLYKKSLANATAVLFQNDDNRQVFINNGFVAENKTFLVNGSGVDVQHFCFKKLNLEHTKFLLIARLLKDKGIAEYIAAAKIVKQVYPHAVFEILGPEDPSPNAYPLPEILKYHDLGVIKYHGATNNVIPYIENSQIFVLPSYHEGLPRTVIEAMSIGRPILTTNAPGCKDTVVEGENGFLVPIKDEQALAQKMLWFIENRNKWLEMGRKSRHIAEDKFDVHKVNDRILKILGIQ